MTDTEKQTTSTKKPSHTAYHVRKNAKGENYWTRIGTMIPHSDGRGFNVLIDIVPLDGIITLRLPTEKAE